MLSPQREAVVASLVALSGDAATATRVLKLSERQRGEIDVNRTLRQAPTMPAVDRYTGVLYDALDAATLDGPARRWLGARTLIHTALLGPVSALDAIPAYRLGATASLPGVRSLRRVWADAVSEALRGVGPSFVLDLRSEAYVALGPVPAEIPSAYVRVVAESLDGTVRALNHFNKEAKGRFVRVLAERRPRAVTPEGVLRWAAGAGIPLRESAVRGEWELVAH